MKCQVCGRNATGIHYGVLACEGCKAFYRRGVEKRITYLCYFGNDCATDSNTRACCKACRFQKCVRLGMKIHGAKLKAENDCDKKKSKRKLIDENGRQKCGGKTSNCSSTQTESMDFKRLIFLEDQCSDRPEINAAETMSFNDDEVTDSIACNSLDIVGRKITFNSSSESFTELIEISSGLAPRRKLVTFMNRYMDVLEDNRRQMALTVVAVSRAVDEVFGDQIFKWSANMERAVVHGELFHQPETTLERMMEALRFHNTDSVIRTQKFAAMMPGTAELDESAKRNVTTGWKWLAFWLIHHGIYMTENDCYVSIGQEDFRYARYWQDLISEGPLLAFIYKFCGEFREMQLTQTETYLLLAVVMFEPGIEVRKHSPEGNTKLELIHRHYTDVLFDALKRRCTDNFQLTHTCRQLEGFFSALKLVYRLHRHYFRALDLTRAPFRAMKGDHNVTVYEALRWMEQDEDCEEFDKRSPLTYQQFGIRIASTGT